MNYSLNRNQRNRKKRLIILGLVTVVLLIAAVAVVRRSYDAKLLPVSASQKSILVTIKSGSSVRQIAGQLKNQGLIRSDWAFEWYVNTKDVRDSLKAGTYSLRPSQNVQDIVDILTQGKINTALVTFPPGRRLDEIRSILINDGFAPGDVDKALNPALYSDHPALVEKPVGAGLEGYLYPESFQKTAATKPDAIIRLSLDEMQKHLTPDLRAAIVRQGLTVYQGIILASIIEQEVSNQADKPVVSQVFLSRLRQNMPLGSDVTAFYGAIIAGQSPSVNYDSPYNTRLHPNLPLGPISNVSASSLQAVASPANTDYLYFVAGDDGKTYFSKTLEDHQAQTQAHCKKLCGNQ